MGTDKKRKDKFKKDKNIVKEMSPYLTLGFELVIPIAGFFFLGHWLDGKYDTEPIWTIILTIYGFITGFYLFLKTALKSNNNKNKGS